MIYFRGVIFFVDYVIDFFMGVFVLYKFVNWKEAINCIKYLKYLFFMGK